MYMNFEIPFCQKEELKLEGIIDVQTVTTRVKIGITRSIVVSFEKYMKEIEWNEESLICNNLLNSGNSIYTQNQLGSIK